MLETGIIRSSRRNFHLYKRKLTHYVLSALLSLEEVEEDEGRVRPLCGLDDLGGVDDLRVRLDDLESVQQSCFAFSAFDFNLQIEDCHSPFETNFEHLKIED